ncbi:MAG: HPr family phosphocarrier protein [Azospirillaceae bacterium]
MNDAGDTRGADAVRRRVTVVNRRGLHARAAAKFVKLAGRFDARVLVCRAGMEVGGNSIMGLMMLAAGPGVEIELTASGPQAREAVDALEGLIAAKFDED